MHCLFHLALWEDWWRCSHTPAFQLMPDLQHTKAALCGAEHKSDVCRHSPSSSATATNVQDFFTKRNNLVTYLVTITWGRQSTHKLWQVGGQQVHYQLVCLSGNLCIAPVLHVANAYRINDIEHSQAFLPLAVSEVIWVSLHSQRRIFKILQATISAHSSLPSVVMSMLQVARNTCNSCWYFPS
jgi:hypothetical protein